MLSIAIICCSAMKRDPALIRQILISIEHLPVGAICRYPSCKNELIVQGYDRRIVAEHIKLLYAAKLIEAKVENSNFESMLKYKIYRLSSDGHEFLAKIRDDDVWDKVLSLVQSCGGNLPLSMIEQLGQEYLAQKLNTLRTNN